MGTDGDGRRMFENEFYVTVPSFRPSICPSVTLRFICYLHFRPPAYTVALSCPSRDHDFTGLKEVQNVDSELESEVSGITV